MIKFKRYPHRVGTPIRFTDRMATMAKNKPERQARKLRKKLPLFAEQIEGGQVDEFDAEAERQRRQKRYDETIQYYRDNEAKCWREARRAFFACDTQTQARILKRFNENRFLPKTATKFAGIVDQESGEQARRLAKCRAEDEARWARMQADEARQDDLFSFNV